MDPLTIASTVIQIGTALDQASSQARQARQMAAALRARKSELQTRANINILNRENAGQKERSAISSNLASAGLANADASYLAASMTTEFSDISNIQRETNWEKSQTELEAGQYDQKASAAKTGGALSAIGTLLNAGQNEYKNNPTFAKNVNDWWASV